MKPVLLDLLVCLHCGGKLDDCPDGIQCRQCKRVFPIRDGIPYFTQVPLDYVPSEKRLRGPEFDTPWSGVNVQFLREQAQKLGSEDVVVDIGAGWGDFTLLFRNSRYLAVDIYPYPGVDLICDLQAQNPFAPASVDAIILSNVIEHIPDAAGFIRSLVPMLKPGGQILITIPFLVKIHQAPYDFARYTHFQLARLASQAGLQVETMRAYYDSAFLVGETERYIRFWVLGRFTLWRRSLLRFALFFLRVVRKWIGMLVRAGFVGDPVVESNPAPVGYLAVFKKERA